MPDYAYTGVPLNVVRDEDAGVYLFGVELDGAWVVIAVRKLGGIDADIAAAKKAQADQPAPPPAPSPDTTTTAEQPPGTPPPVGVFPAEQPQTPGTT